MTARTLLCTAALTLLPSVTPAQENSEPEPLYQVEVIIFRHADQSRTTTEIPRNVEPEIADVLDQQLPRLVAGDMNTDPTTSDSDAVEMEPGWQITTESLFMADDARSIEELDAYELISHLAWVQPAADISIATPIPARALGASADVEGEFKLYRKRYLHLAVNVVLDDSAAASELPTFLQRNPTGPAIVDSRRMRFGRTAYFDQPQFGVLATINKIEEPTG